MATPPAVTFIDCAVLVFYNSVLKRFKPCFGVYVRKQKFLEASYSPWCLIFGHICTYENTTKIQYLAGGGSSQPDKWSDMVQVEPSIAAQVFQNLPWIHIKRAQYEGIYYLLVCHAGPKTCDSLPKVNRWTETSDLGSTLSLESGAVGGKDSHPLLLSCC